MSQSPVPRQPPPEPAAAPSFLRSLKVVAWGLIGIRKASAHQADQARTNVAHLVLAAFVIFLVFIGVLVGVVRWVTAGA